MPGFGWGLAATVATGLLVSTPFFSGTLTPVEPETVQRLGEAQGHALAAITESMPRLDRPQTQPQPQPGVETAVLPGRADDGVSEGLLTAEENGWAKVHRKPGYTEVDVLDPATGKVLQTIRLVSDAGIGDRIRKQVEAGWVRLEPMGNGWSRLVLLDPTTGQPIGGDGNPPVPRGQANEVPRADPAVGKGFIEFTKKL